MATKTQTIATITRFFSAYPTTHSIIEQHPALDDHAIAGFESALDDGLVAILEGDLDHAFFKHPWFGLDEHLIGFVLEHQGGRRDHRTRLFGGQEADSGKHIGPQSRAGILEGNAHLHAPRVRVEHIADEENLSFDNFTRIGGKSDIDRLPL